MHYDKLIGFDEVRFGGCLDIFISIQPIVSYRSILRRLSLLDFIGGGRTVTMFSRLANLSITANQYVQTNWTWRSFGRRYYCPSWADPRGVVLAWLHWSWEAPTLVPPLGPGRRQIWCLLWLLLLFPFWVLIFSRFLEEAKWLRSYVFPIFKSTDFHRFERIRVRRSFGRSYLFPFVCFPSKSFWIIPWHDFER